MSDTSGVEPTVPPYTTPVTQEPVVQAAPAAEPTVAMTIEQEGMAFLEALEEEALAMAYHYMSARVPMYLRPAFDAKHSPPGSKLVG